MDLTAILTLAIAVFGLSIKPGPGMMAIMSRTLSQGMKACFTFILGANIVNMVFLTLVLTGLKIAEDDILFVSILIKSLAAVYLIWLGIKGLQHPDVDLAIKEGQAQRFLDNLSASLMLTFSNPLVILFFAGILPTVLNVPDMQWRDVFIIAGVIIAVETTVITAYSLPVALSRNFITPTLMRRVNIFSSVVIILVGLVIGYSALPAKDLLSLF